MTLKELNKFYTEHLEFVETHWNNLRQGLIKKYMDEGYWKLWAQEKADRDIWELRSKVDNVHPMPKVPTDYDMGVD